MQYSGPEQADFDNVQALNRQYLRLIGQGVSVPGAHPEIERQLLALGDARAGRLAGAPFLLFSLRECEAEYWEAILDETPNGDLFMQPVPERSGERQLVAAALGFLWELAKRNPYAARLVSGASLHWCEQVSEMTLCDLMALAGRRLDVPLLRRADDHKLWARLLREGTSHVRPVRRASQVGALQSLLTHSEVAAARAWRVAARASSSPGLRVAENTEN